jgi:hypothetical protein
MVSKKFTNPPSWITFKIDRERYASWNNANLSWPYCQFTHQSSDEKCSFVWHDQEIPVRIVKRRIFHRGISAINVNGNSLFHGWLSSTKNWNQPFDEIDLVFLGLRDWLPSQLIRMVLEIFFVQVTLYDLERVSRFFKLSLGHWRSHLVKPWFLVLSPFHCEGCTAELFCENSMLQFDRVVLICDN